MPKLQLAKEGLYNRKMNVTRQALDQIVATAVDDIPVVVDHYSGSQYAGGWVRAKTLKTELIENEYSLTAQVDYLEPLKYAIDNEELKHWSILALPTEADGAYKLFHLAFLGADLPAIPGLKQISAEISASNNMDASMEGALVLKYDMNSIPKKENNMEIKELQEEIGKLKLQLSSVTESKEAEVIELKAKFDKATEEMEVIKLERDNLAKQVENQATKEFDALLLELDKVGAPVLPAEELKALVAEYKEQGIECSSQVERQIRIFSKVKVMGPNDEEFIFNKDPKAVAEKKEAEQKANNPVGM